MGKADFWADGEWNFYCDFCGAKNKSSRAMKTWDGYYVCKHHKEMRNPQDFIRGVKDNQSVPWTRPEPQDVFVPSCTQQGSTAIPGYAVPGCSIPGNYSVMFIAIAPAGTYTQAQIALAQSFFTVPYLPPVCTFAGRLAIPSYAVPGCALSGNGPFIASNSVPSYALSGLAVPSVTY